MFWCVAAVFILLVWNRSSCFLSTYLCNLSVAYWCNLSVSIQVQFFLKLIITVQLWFSLDLSSVIPSAPPAAAAPSTSVFSQSHLFYGKHVLTVEALSKEQVISISQGSLKRLNFIKLFSNLCTLLHCLHIGMCTPFSLMD